MKEINFSEIYVSDSGTDESCFDLAKQFRKASIKSFEDTGKILSIWSSFDPSIEIEWHLRKVDAIGHHSESEEIIDL